MDPVAAPTLGGLGGLAPPGVDEVVTTGYAGGPLGVALPPPASSDIGLGALGPPNDPPVPRLENPSDWNPRRENTEPPGVTIGGRFRTAFSSTYAATARAFSTSPGNRR